MSATVITSEVGLVSRRTQSGFLRLPHSVHHAANGGSPVPIPVIRNDDGPALLITAGVHGHAYTGQIAVAQLARTLDPADIHDGLILLPMMNDPEAEAGLRGAPRRRALCNRRRGSNRPSLGRT